MLLVDVLGSPSLRERCLKSVKTITAYTVGLVPTDVDLSHSSGIWKFKAKVLAGWPPREVSVPGLWTGFLLGHHMAFLQCA